ncbi:MAG: energy transducer TonB [Gammaproteobacteria bacterium]|nr:energy transducer TonB [Gammaproteobacteria bacterium]
MNNEPANADATADASTARSTDASATASDKPVPQRHLRKYIATLAAWIDKHKRYPGELKKQHIQGVVTVRFTVRRDGSLLRNEVDRSSGYAQLDEAALATLRACDPFPAFPRQIDRDELNIAVPIEYALIKNR